MLHCMPLKIEDQIYFDNFKINEGAYFYSATIEIKARVIKDAFKRVEEAIVGYKKICKVIKEEISYDGKKAYVSLLVFYSNETPAFLPIPDPKFSLNEKSVGYVLIIEIGEHIALFSRHAKGLSELKKSLQLISPSDLCGALWKEGTLFTRIQASNMNMNPLSLRKKSWEAYDLSAVISTSGTNHNAIDRIKMTKDGDAVTVSLTTSRVTKFASDKRHIKELCKWCDAIINGILDPYDINKTFLRHFAKPVKWKDYAKKLKPLVFLIDTFRLQSLIEDYHLHFIYENGTYGRKICRDTILDGIKKLGKCFNLHETIHDNEYKTNTHNPLISIKLNFNRINVEISGFMKNIKVLDESNDCIYANTDLVSLINSNQAFAVGFDKFDFIYCNGTLHRDEGIINNLDRVLSIFHPLVKMNDVISEKGETKGNKDFMTKTVFHVVEDYFRNNGAIHIVCDDLGYEVSDHIIVSEQSISFVHSKAKTYREEHDDTQGKYKTSLSASNFQTVIGQAVKNIGSVRDLKLEEKVENWKGKCFKDSEIQVYRYGNIDDFSKDYSSVLRLPNSVKEVCLAVNFISKKDLKEAFEKLKHGESFRQKNYVIQMIWLLNDFISACMEADLNCRIFCKP